eukprot:9007575-Lingulodinium_polyedra.AAC.1
MHAASTAKLHKATLHPELQQPVTGRPPHQADCNAKAELQQLVAGRPLMQVDELQLQQLVAGKPLMHVQCKDRPSVATATGCVLQDAAQLVPAPLGASAAATLPSSGASPQRCEPPLFTL